MELHWCCVSSAAIWRFSVRTPASRRAREIIILSCMPARTPQAVCVFLNVCVMNYVSVSAGISVVFCGLDEWMKEGCVCSQISPLALFAQPSFTITLVVLQNLYSQVTCPEKKSIYLSSIYLSYLSISVHPSKLNCNYFIFILLFVFFSFLLFSFLYPSIYSFICLFCFIHPSKLNCNHFILFYFIHPSILIFISFILSIPLKCMYLFYLSFHPSIQIKL